MIIIEVKEGESIDRALRKYKRKHYQVGTMKEIQRRKEFIKPSVQRRKEIQKRLHHLDKLANM